MNKVFQVYLPQSKAPDQLRDGLGIKCLGMKPLILEKISRLIHRLLLKEGLG